MRNLWLFMILGTLPFLSGTQAWGQKTDAGADPVPNVQQVLQWQQCREYLPSKNSQKCRIDFDMTQTKDIRIPPQTHKDITVYLGRDSRGVVVLWRSSPFAACSLTTTLGPLARDLSANISSTLTSMAGLGAIPQTILAEGAISVNQLQSQITPTTIIAPPETENMALLTEKMKAQVLTEQPSEARHLKGKELDAFINQRVQQLIEERESEYQHSLLLLNIHKDEEAITAAIKDFADLGIPYQSLRPTEDPADVNAIRDSISYSYPDDTTARNKLAEIYSHASTFVSRPLPDSKTPPALAAKLEAIKIAVAKLQRTYPDNEILAFVESANEQIAVAQRRLDDAQSPKTAVLVTYLNDATPKIQKLIDFIHDWLAQDDKVAAANKIRPDASVQALPIALYSESKVAVQVKCVDPVTAAPLFDAIQFNAYFQSPPIFDISSGVLISTLHGREATTQTTYTNPSAAASCPANPTAIPPTTSNCPTVVIKRTRPQFMPGVFAEVHLWNFKLPWVRDPAFTAASPPNQIPTWMSNNAPRHAFGYVGSLGLAGGFMVNPNNGTTEAEFFEGVSFGIQRFVFLVGDHNGRSQNLTDGYYIGAPVTPGTTPTTVNNWANGLAFGITYRIPLR
ncbi:MAG: hypothetical protein WA634_05445 [Silvibacterium sp.]